MFRRRRARFEVILQQPPRRLEYGDSLRLDPGAGAIEHLGPDVGGQAEKRQHGGQHQGCQQAARVGQPQAVEPADRRGAQACARSDGQTQTCPQCQGAGDGENGEADESREPLAPAPCGIADRSDLLSC